MCIIKRQCNPWLRLLTSGRRLNDDRSLKDYKYVLRSQMACAVAGVSGTEQGIWRCAEPPPPFQPSMSGLLEQAAEVESTSWLLGV
jgi:hypothetical protein